LGCLGEPGFNCLASGVEQLVSERRFKKKTIREKRGPRVKHSGRACASREASLKKTERWFFLSEGSLRRIIEILGNRGFETAGRMKLGSASVIGKMGVMGDPLGR